MSTEGIPFGVTMTSTSGGPRLDDENRYLKIKSVPIFDVHTREFYREFDNEDGSKSRKRVMETVDEYQLKVIAENSEKRAQEGEYGIVFLGHTNDGESEVHQPPVVGFMKNYRVDNYRDRPAIVADIYIRGGKDQASKILDQFPRRSAEVIRKNKPDGFIDSLALIKRTPERPLGVIADLYQHESDDVERFMCPECENELENKQEGEDMGAIRKKSHSETMAGLAKLMMKVLTETLEQALVSVESGDVEGDMLGDEEGGELGNHDTLEEAGEEKIHPGIHEEVRDMENGGGEGQPNEEFTDAARAAGMNDVADEDKEKYNCGNSSMPGPLNSTPPKVNHMDNEKDRMRKDQGNIEISRYQKIIDDQNKRIAALEASQKATAKQARRDRIERQLVQLQAEGYDFDRAKQMERFSKKVEREVSDEEIQEDLDMIRENFARSPVGQDLIFGLDMEGGVSAPVLTDVGGKTLERAGNAFQEIARHERSDGIYGVELERFRKEVEDGSKMSPQELAMAIVEKNRAVKNSK